MRVVLADNRGHERPIDNLDIAEVDAPELRPGTVRVRVAVGALNRHDLWTLGEAAAGRLRSPRVLGMDASGVIDAAGEGVGDDLRPGTRVLVYPVSGCGVCDACRGGTSLLCSRFGLLSEHPHQGAFAEHLVLPPAQVIALPDAVDDVTAACLPTAYLTAYRMLFTRARLTPGQSILVQGSGGGVASAAILLGRAAGLAVYATSRTEARRKLALDLGAVQAFDSTDPAAHREILAATGGGVDAVIETVGEPTWDLSLRAVRPGGTVAICGTTGGANPPAQLNRVFWKQMTIAGSTMGSRDELVRLISMCEQGALVPLVDSVVPVADAVRAFLRLDAGEQRGKVLLRLADA